MVVVAEADGDGLIAAAVLTVVAVVLMAEVSVVFQIGRMEKRRNAKRNYLVFVYIYLYYFPFFYSRTDN